MTNSKTAANILLISVHIFPGAEPPSCLTPMKLAGKFFNQLSQDDFRCKAPVFNNIDAVFNEHQGRLRCTATGNTKRKHIIIFLNKKAFYATLDFKREAFSILGLRWLMQITLLRCRKLFCTSAIRFLFYLSKKPTRFLLHKGIILKHIISKQYIKNKAYGCIEFPLKLQLRNASG